MSAFVVDTNVLLTASDFAHHASPQCVLASIEALEEIVRSGQVVIDDAFHILEEYRRYLSLSGQPKIGDKFLKWLWDNQGNPAHCEKLELIIGPDGGFTDFPTTDDLKSFDLSDRKFVAAALKSTLSPVILNSVDSDWLNHRKPLEAAGVKIRFLCETAAAPRQDKGGKKSHARKRP